MFGTGGGNAHEADTPNPSEITPGEGDPWTTNWIEDREGEPEALKAAGADIVVDDLGLLVPGEGPGA